MSSKNNNELANLSEYLSFLLLEMLPEKKKKNNNNLDKHILIIFFYFSVFSVFMKVYSKLAYSKCLKPPDCFFDPGIIFRKIKPEYLCKPGHIIIMFCRDVWKIENYKDN